MVNIFLEIFGDKKGDSEASDYQNSLLRYLNFSHNHNLDSLRQSAEEVASIRGEPNLAKTLDEKTNELMEGNEKTWTELLDSVEGKNYDAFREIKAILPFMNLDIKNSRPNRYGSSVADIVNDELRRRGLGISGDEIYTLMVPKEDIEQMRKSLKNAKVYDITSNLCTESGDKIDLKDILGYRQSLKDVQSYKGVDRSQDGLIN